MSMNANKSSLREFAKFARSSFFYFFVLQTIYLVTYLALFRSSVRNSDIYLHVSYFALPNIPYVMVIAAPNIRYLILSVALSIYFGGMPIWWPKITARIYPNPWSKALVLILWIGFSFIFFPQLLMGLWSVHRRYHVYPPEFAYLNIVSTLGATVVAIGLLLPLFYLLWSSKYGSRAISKP